MVPRKEYTFFFGSSIDRGVYDQHQVKLKLRDKKRNLIDSLRISQKLRFLFHFDLSGSAPYGIRILVSFLDQGTTPRKEKQESALYVPLRP